jgi:simple sugar transport system ATP-binding protein
MYRGRVVGVVPPSTSREALGLMMAGVPVEEALASARDAEPAGKDLT